MLNSRESLHADPRRDKYQIRREAVPSQAQYSLQYCQGRVVANVGDYRIDDIVVKSTHLYILPLNLRLLTKGGVGLAEVITRDAEARAPYIDYFIKRGQASVILSVHANELGLLPELAIAEELRQREYSVPDIFPLSWRSLEQTERAILILGKPSEDSA